MSRIIDPFVGLFVAIATLNAAMLIPLFLLLRDDIADMRAVQFEQGERLARIEATLSEHGERLARLEAGRARCAAIWRRPTSAWRGSRARSPARSAARSPNAWRKRRARKPAAARAADGGAAGLPQLRKPSPTSEFR